MKSISLPTLTKLILYPALLLYPAFALSQPLLFNNGYIPEAPPNAKVMAAYMEIKNLSDADVTLNDFHSADFSKVELHKTTLSDGIARMSKQKQLTITAGQTVKLEPGGLHLMLIDPIKPISNGDLVQLEILQTDKTRHIIEISVKKHTAVHQH